MSKCRDVLVVHHGRIICSVELAFVEGFVIKEVIYTHNLTYIYIYILCTPWKSKIDTKNDGLEDATPVNNGVIFGY